MAISVFNPHLINITSGALEIGLEIAAAIANEFEWLRETFERCNRKTGCRQLSFARNRAGGALHPGGHGESGPATSARGRS